MEAETEDKTQETAENQPEAHSGGEDQINIGIITVSDTRDIADDESGNLIKDLAKEHRIVSHVVVKDNKALIKNEIRDLILNSFNPVEVIIVNGGTGITKKDVTIEAVTPLFEKELTGFRTLFSALSYQVVGPKAMLSRATAGLHRGKVIFCLPGNPEACRLAMEKLVLPELGHIVKHMNE